MLAVERGWVDYNLRSINYDAKKEKFPISLPIQYTTE